MGLIGAAASIELTEYLAASGVQGPPSLFHLEGGFHQRGVGGRLDCQLGVPCPDRVGQLSWYGLLGWCGQLR